MTHSNMDELSDRERDLLERWLWNAAELSDAELQELESKPGLLAKMAELRSTEDVVAAMTGDEAVTDEEVREILQDPANQPAPAPTPAPAHHSGIGQSGFEAQLAALRSAPPVDPAAEESGLAGSIGAGSIGAGSNGAGDGVPTPVRGFSRSFGTALAAAAMLFLAFWLGGAFDERPAEIPVDVPLGDGDVEVSWIPDSNSVRWTGSAPEGGNIRIRILPANSSASASPLRVFEVFEEDPAWTAHELQLERGDLPEEFTIEIRFETVGGLESKRSQPVQARWR